MLSLGPTRAAGIGAGKEKKRKEKRKRKKRDWCYKGGKDGEGVYVASAAGFISMSLGAPEWTGHAHGTA